MQESSEDSKRKINEMTSAIEELRNILKETDDGKIICLSSRCVYFAHIVLVNFYISGVQKNVGSIPLCCCS